MDCRIPDWLKIGLIALPFAAMSARAASPPAGDHPAISLQELVGRGASEQSERISVALFRFEPGTVARATYDQRGEEIFVVTRGHGDVLRDREIIAVGPGSVVRVPATIVRSLRVTGTEPFEFYAITTPAWTEDDDVEVSTPANWAPATARLGQ